MKICSWHPIMSDAEAKDLAYWERNMLALIMAEGWYNDDVPVSAERLAELKKCVPGLIGSVFEPRYPGWRRVLTLDGGKITFHIPDDFNVGTLPEVPCNWDGHTSKEKWRRIMAARGIEETP